MRAPTPRIELSSTLRPVASPVDTFVRPTEREPSNLHQVADALGNLDRDLSDYLAKRRQKKDDTDALRGEATFWRNNGMGAAEAVRQGKIPPYASPAFMRAYKGAEGASAATSLEQRFRVEYLNWEGKQGADPEAFDKFFGEFVAKNIGSDDPDILRGLIPRLGNLHAEMQGVFLQDISDNVYNGSLKAHGAEVSSSIDSADLDGRLRPEGTDYETMWSNIMSVRERALGAGARDQDFDRQILESISAKAIQLRDPEILKLLDRPMPGTGYKISDTPEGLALKLDTENKLEAMARQSEADEERATAKANREANDRLTLGAIESLTENPTAGLPEALLAEGSKYDPEFRTKVVGWQKTLLSGSTPEDPVALTEMYSELLAGGGMKTVTEAIGSGVIRDPATLREATSFARSLAGDGENPIAKKVLSGRTFTAVMDSIRQRGKTSDMLEMPWDVQGMTDEALAAQVDYQRMLIDWAQKNPNATEVDIEKVRGEIGKLILDGVTPAGENMTEGKDAAPTYDRPEEVQKAFDNPFSPPKEAPVDPEQAAAAERQAVRDQTIDQFKASASDEERETIENAAKSRGMDPNLLWEKMKEIRGREPAEAPSPDTQGAADPLPASDALGNPLSYAPVIEGAINDAMSAVNDLAEGGNPLPIREGTRGFLDFIGNLEAPAGYNQMYGERTPSTDLAALTLDQVMDLQKERTDGGTASSAVGRYQFLRKTLGSLKRDLGLTGSEPFTPELQDNLAMALLERRGLQRYLAGDISTTRFANNLAKEWASLPVVSGSARGKSFYDGDGLNNALTDPESFLGAFAGLDGKGGPPETPREGVPKAYAKIPEVDGRGDDQIAKFMEWNPDPVGNHEKNLESVEPKLADVIRRAQQISKVPFVVGSGKREEDLQKKAMEWGWSKKQDSHHLHGNAVDLWALDGDEAVTFDEASQAEIARAMKLASEELGIAIDWGGDWKRFKDRPHFQLKS